MSTYGIKDASDLVFRNLRTGDIDLFMDYANASNNEWTSERVYATKKGTNAIAWDGNRTGTLVVESELFDWNYLAMIIGSDVAEGKSDIMQRVAVTVDDTHTERLEGIIDPDTVSVIKLKSDGVEHDGKPIPSTTGNRELLPALPSNLVVNVNDESAALTWDLSSGAENYEVYRDGEQVAVITQNSYNDSGLTPETAYTYSVVATNEYGESPASAEVEALTSEQGVTSRSAFEATEEAIQAAEQAEGALNETGSTLPTFEFTDNEVRFNEHTRVGDQYAIYFMEEAQEVRTISIDSDKFPDSYEIFGNALVREQETGQDQFLQIHYKNARPQSNFTLTQSASEPTTLSATFDLFPNKSNNLAEYKLIK